MIQADAVNRRRWWDEDEVVASLDFGLARDAEDFDGAFRLVHDQYVQGGYMAPHPSGRRLGIFNAVPTTRVFVARAGARVVGTLSLVQDSPVGLPMDQIYREELSGFRARGRRLGEASTLTLDPAYRASGVAILMRLVRMMTVYAASIARLHDLCIAVAPHHGRFYRTCFPFEPLGPARPYPRVNGISAIGFRADLTLVRALIRVAQHGLPLGSRYDFLFGQPHYRQVLARLRRDVVRSALTPDQVRHFFAGHATEVAAAELLTTMHRAQNGERSRRHQLTA